MRKYKGQKCKCGQNKVWLPPILGTKSKPCPFCGTIYIVVQKDKNVLDIIEYKEK